MSDQNEFSYDHMSDREVLISVAKDVSRLGVRSEDHEGRIKEIEKAKTYAAGAMAGLSLLGFGWLSKLHLILQHLAEKPSGHS